MWLIIIISSITGTAFLCWAVAKGNLAVRLLATFAALVLFGYLGYEIGKAQEREWCYSSYVYWFSEYSAHLHNLVKEQRINALTNDVVLFNTRFSNHKDAKTLQNTMYEILKIGPYFRVNTNTDFSITTNSTRGAIEK